MACSLGPEVLCGNITNLRVAEDAVATLVAVAIIYMLLDIGYNMIKQGPLFKRILVLALSFVPFLVWKFFGAIRRIFLDNSSAWYSILNDFGEVMEALTALFILGGLVYMYLLIKPEKIVESEPAE